MVGRDIAPSITVVHLRTQTRLGAAGISLALVQVRLPIGCLEMLDLVGVSNAVSVDSGGIQERTTPRGVSCFAPRATTERSIRTSGETKRRVQDPPDLELVRHAAGPFQSRRPEGWDGHAGELVIAALANRIPPIAASS
jgi:UDP-N-acetylglucosamine 2-epimerase